MPYEVGKFEPADKKMRTLNDFASLAGIRQADLDALRVMLERLQDDPHGWDDPLYGTKHPGGLVCHGVIGPIGAKYVIFEAQKKVMIMDVNPLFEWPIRP